MLCVCVLMTYSVSLGLNYRPQYFSWALNLLKEQTIPLSALLQLVCICQPDPFHVSVATEVTDDQLEVKAEGHSQPVPTWLLQCTSHYCLLFPSWNSTCLAPPVWSPLLPIFLCFPACPLLFMYYYCSCYVIVPPLWLTNFPRSSVTSKSIWE